MTTARFDQQLEGHDFGAPPAAFISNLPLKPEIATLDAKTSPPRDGPALKYTAFHVLLNTSKRARQSGEINLEVYV